MGFIALMEQGMLQSLVVQMEHMEMEPSFFIQISVLNVPLDDFAMVSGLSLTLIIVKKRLTYFDFNKCKPLFVSFKPCR